MHSSVPKVMHHVGGVPMLERVVQTAGQLDPVEIYVVHGNGGSHVRQHLKHLPVHWVEQNQRLGTGHAVLQVMDHVPMDHMLLVLYGDVPLVGVNTLLQLRHNTPKQGVGVVVAKASNPAGFGRIVRDEMGHITAIVEHKDATDTQRQLDEINTGILMAKASLLKQWLPCLSQQNAQGEYYLTDVVGLAVAEGHSVGGVMASCYEEVMGVNNRQQLAQIERYYQGLQAEQLMLHGVTLIDPDRFDLRGQLKVTGDITIDVNVVITGDNLWGQNIEIGPGCVLHNVRMANDVQIGAFCVLSNVTIESGTCIADHCVIKDTSIGASARVGPFARLRPGTSLAAHCQVGNFVEMKNTQLGEGAKVNHLSYMGDASVGQGVNIGAGTITCNYDGVKKHTTRIEDHAMVGANSSLVAPVMVGEGATLGAGTVLVEDAPAHTLTLSRSKQQLVEGWQRPKKEKQTTEQEDA